MYLLPFTLVIIPLLSVLRPPSPFYATEQGQTKQERKKQGRINHASHFVTPGSTALKLYSRFEENSP